VARVPGLARTVQAAACALALLALATGCTGGSSSDGAASTTAVRRTTSTTSSARPPGPTAPTTPTQGLGEGFAPEQDGRRSLRGFSEVVVTVIDSSGKSCTLCLMAATTEAQRERGLMEVTDPELGGYDGMLFEFPDDQDGAFWMRNTPMPLSIAYFDRVGEVVSITDMAPCADKASCPSYPAGATFRYALEVPKGQLGDALVAKGSRMTIIARKCPLASPAG